MGNTTNTGDSAADNMLLHAYTQLVTRHLFDALMEEVKPKIRKAAEDAAKELRPQIEARYDHLSQGLLVHISVKEYQDGPQKSPR